MNKVALFGGALLAASGVMLGAFGTHGLRAFLDAEALGWWETGVRYQLWHALGLIAISALPLQRLLAISMLLIAGVLIFSGSLFLMALTDARWLGAVTPIGGMAMIAGWLLLAWQARPFTAR